ncbi:MAM and LDL-receptor class A domain-containing protein 1-like [Anneissia japonica]|uniref:MAM and LDL-receptor class A domain-containing protein 1-like n=1 Tax=Anneissia japonica TaxID=1529436 RepID=UPI001425635E|nr:MAM and LDL-receptor class A domain-containing protein 1-like [Anneissia japonica]
MYGEAVNTLNVYAVDSTGIVGSPVWTKTNNQGNNWIFGKVSVAVFGIYQIMFEGIIGSSYTSDIGLDDITITNRACSLPDSSQCDFEDPNICNFVQDTMDDFDWTRGSASTSSTNTGPSFDHTLGTSQGGYYLYIEATGRSSNDIARLWTPSYPASKGLCIEWFYHMYGNTVNTLNVYVVDSTGTVGTPVWNKTNNQGDTWLLGQVSVAEFGIYQILFEGIRGSGYTGDIALDDVKITNGACVTQRKPKAFSQCDFEYPSSCNLVQDTNDDFDWSRRSASTPSFDTGPSFDHTLGTCQGGYYMYIEATGQTRDDIARLWTPSYPATNGLCIEWFFHMYGATVNTLNVYIVDSTGAVGSPVWTRTNNQGNFWILGQVSVSTSGIYRVMFEGIRGVGFTGDISLDDVTITDGACST